MRRWPIWIGCPIIGPSKHSWPTCAPIVGLRSLYRQCDSKMFPAHRVHGRGGITPARRRRRRQLEHSSAEILIITGATLNDKVQPRDVRTLPEQLAKEIIEAC